MTPNEVKELEVQKIITKHVDDFNSFRFNAGAGSGKTYALIETLKYVATNKIVATKSPQKVVCITYTNVAVNEIKSRLGNSEIVYVSTIHERLWALIKNSQHEILICHKEKIEDVIEEVNQDLYGSDKSKFFIELDESQKSIFIEFSTQTKDDFYQCRDLNAGMFRDYYKDNLDVSKPDFLDKCLANVKNFQYVVGLIYKKKRLKDCLDRIGTGEESQAIYDGKVNVDILHRMKFSHDTLLEYGLKLIKKYPILCRIIIDNYPYFFIDEYQDTHSNVIEFFKTIHDYALENNKYWMVGYFGDTAQSIYNDGVGQRIEFLHRRLLNVDKIFNRRSHKQIICVANKIRADYIVQEPIFQDRTNGSVLFYHNKSENKIATAQEFLVEYKNDLINDNEDTKIHCLVLTNKLMANFNGFEEVYSAYNNSNIYYNDLSSQAFSNKLENLHPTVLNIYHLVKLYQCIKQAKVSYYDVFGASSKDMAFSKASLVIRELESKDVTSLRDWVCLISDRLDGSSVSKELGEAIINSTNFERNTVASAEEFKKMLSGSINALMRKNSDTKEIAKEKIDSILTLRITSLINWINFIDGVENNDISYHTYHSTKGEEYNNVAIILEHSFGMRNINKFKNYFNILQKIAEGEKGLFSDPEERKKHINTQNLLYVACSRAIKNLRILYLDDISEIEEGIKVVFGECSQFCVSDD